MRDRTPVQSVAVLVGAFFVLVGVLGFVPGVTDHVHDLSFAGHGSGAKLLGLFQVSILHNLVHLTFGIVGIAIAKTRAGARNFLIGGGGVYLALWVLGVAGGGDWIPANTADNMLHFGLGIGMIGLAFITSRSVTSRSEALRPSCVT